MPHDVVSSIGDTILQEEWTWLWQYLVYPDFPDQRREDMPEPLADIVRKILNEVRLQEFRKKHGKQ